jgi:hypothetical protein
MMYDAKITKESTWLDYYFSIMLTFQFSAFVVMVCSSRISRAEDAAGDDKLDAAVRQRAAHAGAAYPAFYLANLAFGGADVVFLDRLARRILMPFFYVSQMLVCFFPWSGDGSIAGSDATGFAAPLFHINAFCLGVYLLIGLGALLTGVELDATPPPRDDDCGGDVEAETVEAGTVAYAPHLCDTLGAPVRKRKTRRKRERSSEAKKYPPVPVQPKYLFGVFLCSPRRARARTNASPNRTGTRPPATRAATRARRLPATSSKSVTTPPTTPRATAPPSSRARFRF